MSWGLARDMLMLIGQDNSRNQAWFLNEQKKSADKTLKFTPGQKKKESWVAGISHFVGIHD